MSDRSIEQLIATGEATLPLTLKENAVYGQTDQVTLEVKGPDAASFLQGQLSCDVNQLTTSMAGLGTHSTPKGRMLSSFRISSSDEQCYRLQLHESIADAGLAALKKYIVFSKAEIAQTDIVCVGLHGAAAATWLASKTDSLPTENYAQLIANDVIIVCVNASVNAYQVTGTSAALTALFSDVPAEWISDSRQATLIAQASGLAFVEADSVELFIPQMLNYQETPAISFTKGCYTGQEIVARMKYLGKMKRHMYVAIVRSGSTDAAAAIAVAASVSLEAGSQNQGNIASSVQLDSHTWQILMVLTDSAKESPTLFVNDIAVDIVEFLPLPYTVDA
ncbi:tRNA-modifying protein YgfZ [BD1-7 clade bacterium]|uniref:tRNA-modifying protein YgfZ n=1 Tax=BD1-7 clade bacterium TaxID=2029982 RepID=A0A5S9PA31_9GAMM|nr:tRNA-modifying protein YgfZ [BD1-7 clade bacterium]CAA0116048.1 tRNA-modifying protein YgfZ [BD1-7 clade bacterium]